HIDLPFFAQNLTPWASSRGRTGIQRRDDCPPAQRKRRGRKRASPSERARRSAYELLTTRHSISLVQGPRCVVTRKGGAVYRDAATRIEEAEMYLDGRSN